MKKYINPTTVSDPMVRSD